MVKNYYSDTRMMRIKIMHSDPEYNDITRLEVGVDDTRLSSTAPFLNRIEQNVY